MNNARAKVMVVEDERHYLALIRLNLELAGHLVVSVTSGLDAVELAAAEQPDLILLDLRLPGLNGLEVCRRIRRFSTTSIIMITAKAEEENVIEGLNAGADDYLTKPFGVGEMLARVNAQLRRQALTSKTRTEPLLEVGSLRLDRAQKRVYRSGVEVILTDTEYRLLEELAVHYGEVLSASHLLYTVWGPGYADASPVLRQTVYRLRQKLEVGGDPQRLLHTRPGQGYVLTTSAA